MKTRAAIAYAAGKPLEVVEVDLDGPKAGEVLVEIRATGVCHTDEFTRSGADPEGLFPVIFGHEGAGVVVDVGPGSDEGFDFERVSERESGLADHLLEQLRVTGGTLGRLADAIVH